MAKVLVDTGPLVAWLAEESGISEGITLDETDFGIYRLPGGKRLTNFLSR